MARPRKPTRGVVRAKHIKFAAIRIHSLLKNKRALKTFFTWRRQEARPWPSSPQGIDREINSWINYLYAGDMPMYIAADSLSGVKRYLPEVRKALPISDACYKY